jgi:hypothetical protein
MLTNIYSLESVLITNLYIQDICREVRCADAMTYDNNTCTALYTTFVGLDYEIFLKFTPNSNLSVGDTQQAGEDLKDQLYRALHTQVGLRKSLHCFTGVFINMGTSVSESAMTTVVPDSIGLEHHYVPYYIIHLQFQLDASHTILQVVNNLMDLENFKYFASVGTQGSENVTFSASLDAQSYRQIESEGEIIYTDAIDQSQLRLLYSNSQEQSECSSHMLVNSLSQCLQILLNPVHIHAD